MSVHFSLLDWESQSNFFHRSKAGVTDFATVPLDCDLHSSVIPMLGQSTGSLDSFHHHTSGLRGHCTLHLVEDASPITTSSPGYSFEMSSSLSTSNHCISLDVPGGSKTNKVAPQAVTFEAAIDAPEVELENNKEDAKVSIPRTRSRISPLPKQRQTKQQTHAKPEAQRPEQQRAALEGKRSAAKSKNANGNGRRKSQFRNHGLERKRIAASKCRQRKKEWLTDLEATKSKLEKQHTALHGKYDELLDEVTQLKNLLMIHASCNDSNIDEWIDYEADIYTRRRSQDTTPESAAAVAAATTKTEANLSGYKSKCYFTGHQYDN